MKFIQQTVHYGCRSSEECGLFTEKIVCDILGIKFNSRRAYINERDYPTKLKNDIAKNVTPLLKSLNIQSHLGNKNDYYDFNTISSQTVSLKSNISGYKVCPQIIGQVSLNNFNKETGNDIQSNYDYKSKVFQNPGEMVNLYLTYLFCCDHTISLQLEQGIVHYFKKQGDVTLTQSRFKFSKDIDTWNESMTMSVKLNEEYVSLCEFQIHNHRNCVKCRFNMNTVICLIESNLISNVLLQSVSLDNSYKIRVQKALFKDD